MQLFPGKATVSLGTWSKGIAILNADPESSMAKIQAIFFLVGMLFIATLLVDPTTCFVTKSKREEIKVGKIYEIVKECIIIYL